jgi:hypothetical protein
LELRVEGVWGLESRVQVLGFRVRESERDKREGERASQGERERERKREKGRENERGVRV